ncbi:MAG: flagellar hook-associated protein FlgL [Lachnospiraceae bacterium]|nr:flagellar hook-associated protein FlgL [Lachnospiraceae bacterium]
MGTRITNKIISNNAGYNIQINKRALDKLATQQATEKKINDPSDDPVVAMRSLRFRSSYSDISQYLDKNLADAKSWVDSSQTALTEARDIVQSIKHEFTSGANGTNKTSDRETYLTQIRALVDQYYSIGNSTNEDRYLFTGYRTSDSLTFTENNIEERTKLVGDGNPAYDYVIEEEFDKDDITSYSFLSNNVSDTDITEATAETTPTNVAVETDINEISGYRIRLAYDNIDDSTTERTTTDLVPGKVTIDGTEYSVEYITDDTAAIDTTTNEITDGTIYVNTTTGNMIFGETIKTAMAAADDISFVYEKTEWSTGDLKPEHYFNCVDVALNEANSTKYPTILEYDDAEQSMEYAVGNAQSIAINTNANDAFMTDVGRDIDEMEDILDSTKSAEQKLEKIKAALEEDPTNEELTYLKAAAEKELDFYTSKLKDMFKDGITSSGNYYDQVNLAATQSGTVQNRITIITARLTENKTTVQEQASNNENVQLSDIAIDIQEATLIYNSSLIVTGKISQQTLLNYI